MAEIEPLSELIEINYRDLRLAGCLVGSRIDGELDCTPDTMRAIRCMCDAVGVPTRIRQSETQPPMFSVCIYAKLRPASHQTIEP